MKPHTQHKHADTHIHTTFSPPLASYATPLLSPYILTPRALVSGFLITAQVLSWPLGDFAAEHLQHQRGELHAVLRLEGERTVLFGVLLVEAAQVGQFLDHLGINQPSSWVVKLDVGLQGLGQSVLEGFDSCVVLHTWAVCREERRYICGCYIISGAF